METYVTQEQRRQIEGEEWKSLLKQQKTLATFKFPLTDIQAAKSLYYQYKSEVIGRRGETAWQESKEMKQACMTMGQVLTDKNDMHFGFLLRGTNGNGKTTLANAFHKVVNSLAQMQYLGNCKGAINRTAKEIVRCYETSMFGKILKEPVVIIDDLGNETTEMMNYGNIATPIVDMIEYRYDNKLFTFITTNLTADQIEEKYGKRIRDRLREMVVTITIEGGSYRN